MINPRDADALLAAAARRFISARDARLAARRAQVDYWQSMWPPAPEPDEDNVRDGYFPPPREESHRFGMCPSRITTTHEDQYIDDRKPVCAKCAGSEPFYQAYRAAAKEQGAALRALMRLTKYTAKRGES